MFIWKRDDWLDVRDGDNENADLIGRLSGREVPSPIISRGNGLFLRFYSNSFYSYSGYRILVDVGKIWINLLKFTQLVLNYSFYRMIT